MPFDPNQPFEVIDAQTPTASFDPNQPFEVISTQGGEQNEQSQPEANTDSDEQRKANEQVQPPNEAGVQASSMRLPEPQGEEQRVGNIDPNLKPTTQATTGGETIAKETQQATKGSQGQEDGQGLRGQVPSGNEAQVREEQAKVPTLAKVRGMAISPFAYIGEAGWKGIAGIADTLNAKDLAAYATEQSVGAIQNLKVLGAEVPEEGIGRTIGEVAAFAVEAPLMFTPVGMIGFIAQGYGGMKEDLKAGYLKNGLSEEEANRKSTNHAALATAAAIPAYFFAGKVGGEVADAFFAESAPKVMELTARFGINGAANMVASAATRGFAAGIEGESITDAMKNVTFTGVLQDFAFAGHSTGELFLKSKEKAEFAKGLSDSQLAASTESKDRAIRSAANDEIASRLESQKVEAAKGAELPETAKVLESSNKIEGKADSSIEAEKVDTSEEVESIYKTAEEALAAGDTEAATLSLNAAKEAELNPENATFVGGQKAREDRWNAIDSAIEESNAKTTLEGDVASEMGKVEEQAQEIDLSGSIEARDILGLNMKKAFGYIENNKNTPEPLRALVKAVSEFAGDKKLAADIVRRMPEDGERGFAPDMKGSLGMRIKRTNSIYIPKGKVEVATVVHEGMHTLTQNEIDQHVGHYQGETGYTYLERLNEALGKDTTPEPVKRLINLYKLTLSKYEEGGKTAFETYFDGVNGKAGMDGDGHAVYGFKDLHEFVGEAFSNKDFQDILKGMKGDGGKTLWQNFIDVVSVIFNIPKGSMLESVMDASLSISKIERESPSEVQKRFSKANNLSKETSKVAKEVSAVFSKKSDPNKWRKEIERIGMFRDDLVAMGVDGAAKELAEEGKNLVPWLVKSGGMVSDVLEGRIIPKLTRAGVKLAAIVHAQAKRSIDPVVKDIISKVFPEKYKMSAEGIKEISDIEWSIEKLEREQKRLEKYKGDQYSKSEYAKMQGNLLGKINTNKKLLAEAKDKYDLVRKTMKIINKDNILGGADTITEEIAQRTREMDALKASEENGTGGRGIATKIKNTEQHIVDFNESLEAIKRIHDLDQYAKDVEAAKGTDIEEDIQRWKEVVNPIMDDLYKRANNTDEAPQTERGRVFGARVNLLAEWEANKFMEMDSVDGPPQPMMSVDYRNPDIKADRLAKRALFNTEYSNDAEAILKNSLTARTNEATKLDFYKALINEGVAIFADANDNVTELKGKPVQRIEFEMPVKTKDGKTKLENRTVWIQSELYKEVKQILDMTERGEQNPFAQGSTMMQLVGIADMVAHLKNLHSAVANALGRDSHAKDLMSKIPFMSALNAGKEIFAVMKEIQMDGPKIRAEKAELARLSGLRPNYDQAGIMRLLTKHQHEFLHETDIASRVIMARRYKNLVERFGAEDTPEAKIDFVNQIGEYNRRLMARWEASLRDSGWSPFIVAGRAMNRMSRRLVLGQTGFKARDAKAQLQARAIQASGLVMATVLPSMINLMTTGSMFGRNGTPIGAIDFGPNFDTSDGKRRIFDLFQMVGIRRGLRQLGINALVEGLRSGLPHKEIQKNIGNDIMTTSLHPIMGPGLGLAMETLTGKRLDMRVGFSDIYTARKVGGLAQYVENFRTGLKQQNELLYSAGLGYAIEKGMELGDIPRPMEQNESETMRDLGIPNVPVVKQLFTAGATAAGAFGAKLSVSPALKLSSQLGSKQQYTPKQDIRYHYRKEILKSVADKDMVKAKQIYQKGIEEGVLTKADDKTLKGKITQPDLLIQRTSRLKTAEDALSVFRVADAEEQDKIAGIVYKKIAGSSAINKKEAMDFFAEFKKVAKEGTKVYNKYNK